MGRLSLLQPGLQAVKSLKVEVGSWSRSTARLGNKNEAKKKEGEEEQKKNLYHKNVEKRKLQSFSKRRICSFLELS